MAHFQKYKGSNAYLVLKHDSRENTDNRENIDHAGYERRTTFRKRR